MLYGQVCTYVSKYTEEPYVVNQVPLDVVMFATFLEFSVIFVEPLFENISMELGRRFEFDAN